MVSGTYQKLRTALCWLRCASLLAALFIVFASPAAAQDCATEQDASPLALHPDYATGAQFHRIRLLGSLRLGARRVDGLSVHGLSGLSWSVAQQRLYAVSDQRASKVLTAMPAIEVTVMNMPNVQLDMPTSIVPNIE